ncbi:hypothetical protein CL616_00865 [archaeon]|nr:hypothetical protein [archaeon]
MRKNIIIVGSLLVDWVFVDNADGDSQVQNETKWTENGALKTGLLNSTRVPTGNLEELEVWNVSVRVHDGTEWSGWSTNLSLTILEEGNYTDPVPEFPSGTTSGGGGFSISTDSDEEEVEEVVSDDEVIPTDEEEIREELAIGEEELFDEIPVFADFVQRIVDPVRTKLDPVIDEYLLPINDKVLNPVSKMTFFGLPYFVYELFSFFFK